MNTKEFLAFCDTVEIVRHGELPDLLTFSDGSPVRTTDDWERRRKEVADAVIPGLFGGMPPAVAPEAVETDLISICTCEGFCHHMDTMNRRTIRVTVRGGLEPVVFDVNLWSAANQSSPAPLLLEGDGCWSYLTEEVITGALRRGWVVAQFNRCVFARDEKNSRDRGLYRAFPGSYGAIAAWAWGYHRAIDALLRTGFVDPERIAITGHSRGGKTVLLAGATDTRIGAVGDNSSGCCGSGNFRAEGQGAERIDDIVNRFGFWFAEDLGRWAGHEAEMPFDHHFTEALLAPRGLFIRHAKEDLWANPAGALETYRAARKVWELLGAPEKIAFSGRDRKHFHEPSDFERYLDFCEAIFRFDHR